jgi:hypothetical protein
LFVDFIHFKIPVRSDCAIRRNDANRFTASVALFARQRFVSAEIRFWGPLDFCATKVCWVLYGIFRLDCHLKYGFHVERQRFAKVLPEILVLFLTFEFPGFYVSGRIQV